MEGCKGQFQHQDFLHPDKLHVRYTYCVWQARKLCLARVAKPQQKSDILECNFSTFSYLRILENSLKEIPKLNICSGHNQRAKIFIDVLTVQIVSNRVLDINRYPLLMNGGTEGSGTRV